MSGRLKSISSPNFGEAKVTKQDTIKDRQNLMGGNRMDKYSKDA